MKQILILLAITIILVSCTERIMDFTVISSKTIDLTKGTKYKRGASRVTGEDLAHWIIIIPTHTVTVKQALDKAIEKTPGCVALIDGVIFSKFWWIPWIYGQQCIIVEGTPLIDPSTAYNTNEIPEYSIVEFNNKGELKKYKEINEVEYQKFKSSFKKIASEQKFRNSENLN